MPPLGWLFLLFVYSITKKHPKGCCFINGGNYCKGLVSLCVDLPAAQTHSAPPHASNHRYTVNKKTPERVFVLLMAETMGFEPMRRGYPTYSLSRGAPSATQPSFHPLMMLLKYALFY